MISDDNALVARAYHCRTSSYLGSPDDVPPTGPESGWQTWRNLPEADIERLFAEALGAMNESG